MKDGHDTETPTSRRQFLANAGKVALGATFLTRQVWTVAATPDGPAWVPASADAVLPAGPNWGQLERGLRGSLLRPRSSGYGTAIKIRNIRYASVRPAGVAMVSGAKDIATAIAWARDNEVEMVPRSGGHCYGGYSTTRGLVINLNGMTKISVDARAGTMTTVGAATNQGVLVAGKPYGAALPGGQCPTVGIPGFTLGGGLGFSMRQFGLAIDALQETTIVMADGKVLTASHEEHPDLFWALCGGGGGNFGINTSFKFKTFKAPKQVTVFSLTWTGDDCIQAFMAFQEVLLPRELGAIAHFSVSTSKSGAKTPGLRIFGRLVGNTQTIQKLLQPVQAAAQPKTSYMKEMSLWSAKRWLGSDEGPPNAFAERSRFHPKPLAEEGVHAVLNGLLQAPIGTAGKMSSDVLFFAWGGAVSDVAPTATAFVHRNDVWLQAFNSSWDLDLPQAKIDELVAWQISFYDEFATYGSDRAFQNFIDPALVDPMGSYYAENQARLVEMKWKYDPKNVFHFAQSIRG